MRKNALAGLLTVLSLNASAAAAEPPGAAATEQAFGWFGTLAGDSVFEWDAANARIRYSNWADMGTLQHGEAAYDGDLLRFPDVKSQDEEPRTRSTWRRIDADSFEVTRERREGDAWQALFSVTYRRAAPVAPPGDPPR